MPRRPVETHRISRFSRLGCLRMHRVFDSAASADISPNNGVDDVAFSRSGQDRHTEVMISELNGWPAFPLADATPATLPSPAQGFKARVTGYVFSVGLFHSQSQAGLSRRFPRPLLEDVRPDACLRSRIRAVSGPIGRRKSFVHVAASRRRKASIPGVPRTWPPFALALVRGTHRFNLDDARVHRQA